MARKPPIKRRPLTPDKLPPIPNREAILKAQEIVDTQLAVKDSADTAAGAAPRRADDPSSASPGGVGSVAMVDEGAGEVAYVETMDASARHLQRLGWFYDEASAQAANRRLMARDEAMYDNEQWSQEDAAEMDERGQDPIVYNEIGPTIDWLIGTERRSRVDFFVVAEDDDDDTVQGQTQPSDDAINKTKLLKYLDDVNMAPFERSYAADDCFKAGMGILEIGLRGDKSGAPIFVGAESWRNFLHDRRAKKDQSDARYNFRIKELDLDVAIALFPNKEDVLRASITAGSSMSGFRGAHLSGSLTGLDSFGEFAGGGDGEYDGVSRTVDFFDSRDRVTIIECWSREPVRRQMVDGNLGDPITFRVRVSLMVDSETLLETWSPYKHDRFPFVLYWAYRNKRTGLPYSPIRRLVGPQKGLNRRMARGLFESSFNQIDIEKGAIDKEGMTIEQIAKESADPNGIRVWGNGALSGDRVRFRENPGQAREQILLAEGDRQALRMMSGINEENRGLQSQATSRVAMDAKAERGSIQTTELFDNQLLARQQEGEITLSLCEQFVKQPMTIRVAGESGQGGFERVKLNQPGHYDEATGEPVYINDITARRSHFVVGEQAYKQSYAEAAFDSLMQVLTQLATAAPQIVVGLLDVVFDMHPNLPRKKAVIERIRALNGQVDPDGKMTPEQQAEAQKKAQIAQAQFELQMAGMQAEVVAARAKGEKLSVEAIQTRLTALYEAAQAAQVLSLAPGIAPMADALLSSAGFVDQSNTATPGSDGKIVSDVAPADEMPTDPRAQTATGPQGRMAALAGLHQGDGAAAGHQAGIETARPDGAPGA